MANKHMRCETGHLAHRNNRSEIIYVYKILNIYIKLCTMYVYI